MVYNKKEMHDMCSILLTPEEYRLGIVGLNSSNMMARVSIPVDGAYAERLEARIKELDEEKANIKKALIVYNLEKAIGARKIYPEDKESYESMISDLFDLPIKGHLVTKIDSQQSEIIANTDQAFRQRAMETSVKPGSIMAMAILMHTYIDTIADDIRYGILMPFSLAFGFNCHMEYTRATLLETMVDAAIDPGINSEQFISK